MDTRRAGPGKVVSGIMAPRIAIGDRNAFADLLAIVLHETFGVVGDAQDARSTLELVVTTRPDVLLVDSGIQADAGTELVHRVAVFLPRTMTVIMYGDGPVQGASSTGAFCHLDKRHVADFPSLLQEAAQAFTRVLEGRTVRAPLVLPRNRTRADTTIHLDRPAETEGGTLRWPTVSHSCTRPMPTPEPC